MGLDKCFSNIFVPSPPFHSRHMVVPPSLIKQTEGSIFKDFV